MADPIDTVLKNEGGVVNDPQDKGGLTAFGISQSANPEAFASGLPTEDQARAIYQAKYVVGPHFDLITDNQLRTQLIDFGVNSGPSVAIQKLQALLGLPQDGVLGPQTLAAVATHHAEDLNNGLVVARVKMIGKIVTNNSSQLKFLNGWLDRALQFLG